MSFEVREKCGIAAVYGYPQASSVMEYLLRALQHRGTESAGITTSDQVILHTEKTMGLVSSLFTPAAHKVLLGCHSIGHTRYSTAGSSDIANAQPLVGKTNHGPIAVAHNGNITNANDLRSKLELRGALFQTDSDTEVILHLIAQSAHKNLTEAIKDSLAKLEGAFSLVFLTTTSIIAARDPQGFRPLVMGTLTHGSVNSVIFASETCAIDLIGAVYTGNVKAGELVVVDKAGIRMDQFAEPQLAECVFEHVYFSDPESYSNGRSEYSFRRDCGQRLAKESPALADIVIPVPNSGIPAAFGYAKQSNIPMEMGLIRKDHVGRTFIQPTDEIRRLGVKLKLRPVKDIIQGKRVVLIDDSIIRGTTSRLIVQMVRDAGAVEVHLRIACPPTISPCYYGVDTPKTDQLIAAQTDLEGVRKATTADTLGYLSLESLKAVVDGNPTEYCYACYTGHYPANLVQIKL